MGHALCIDARWKIFQRYFDVYKPCLNVFSSLSDAYSIYFSTSSIGGLSSDCIFWLQCKNAFLKNSWEFFSIGYPIQSFPVELLLYIGSFLVSQYWVGLCKFGEINRILKCNTFPFSLAKIREEYPIIISKDKNRIKIDQKMACHFVYLENGDLNSVLSFDLSESFFLAHFKVSELLICDTYSRAIELQSKLYPYECSFLTLSDCYHYAFSHYDANISDIYVDYIKEIPYNYREHLGDSFMLLSFDSIGSELFQVWKYFRKGLSLSFFNFISQQCFISNDILVVIFSKLKLLHYSYFCNTFFSEFCSAKFSDEYGASMEVYPFEFEYEYCDNGNFYPSQLVGT